MRRERQAVNRFDFFRGTGNRSRRIADIDVGKTIWYFDEDIVISFLSDETTSLSSPNRECVLGTHIWPFS